VTTSDVAFTSWHPRTLLNESAGSQPAPEELREQARNEGYAAGYNQGLEAGKKEAFERGSEKVAELKSLIDALDQPFKNIEVDVSEYLLSLVFSVCKAILHRELSTDSQYIQTALDRALQLLSGGSGNVNLKIHPDDAEAVNAIWSDELGELKIVSAPEITRGGCLIQRNDSLIDATIESQLRQIISDLSVAPGPINSMGESADLLDSNKVELTTNRLGEDIKVDE
jgi:flagellar assembly protein FliH